MAACDPSLAAATAWFAGEPPGRAVRGISTSESDSSRWMSATTSPDMTISPMFRSYEYPRRRATG